MPIRRFRLRRKGIRPRFMDVGIYFLLILLTLFFIAPFLWMVMVSLHPSQSPIPALNQLLPDDPQWNNYEKILFNPSLPVSRFFWNSCFVAIVVVGGQTVISSFAAFALSRLKFKGRHTIFFLFISTMMFGSAVTQVPVYLMLQRFGWLNTYYALIVPSLSSAFTIFLLRQAFLAIPFELDEAARIDGASDYMILWRIILPLSKAALATAGTFTFISVWTDFFGPLLYTTSVRMRTLEVGLSIYHSSFGGTNWPLEMCASVIVLTPLLIVFLVGQRFFVRGITLGSIK